MNSFAINALSPLLYLLYLVAIGRQLRATLAMRPGEDTERTDMLHIMIQLRTGRLTRTWLVENYARVVKENECGAVNKNNTIENTLKMPYRLNVLRIFY